MCVCVTYIICLFQVMKVITVNRIATTVMESHARVEPALMVLISISVDVQLEKREPVVKKVRTIGAFFYISNRLVAQREQNKYSYNLHN